MSAGVRKMKKGRKIIGGKNGANNGDVFAAEGVCAADTAGSSDIPEISGNTGTGNTGIIEQIHAAFVKVKTAARGLVSGTESDEAESDEADHKNKGARIWSGILQFVEARRAVIFKIVLPALYCVLFGSVGLDSGVYPFAISAVCAVSAGIPALISAAGTTVASLFVRGGFYIAITSVGAAAILSVLKKLRGERAENAVIRAGLSLAAGSVQTLLMASSGGISFYELCGVMMMAAVCPVLTSAFRGIFTVPSGLTSGAEAGIWALIYTVAYSVRYMSPAGISISVFMSMAGTLYATYAFGVKRGVITGVAFGLAAPPQYSLIYAAAAAGSGILMGISPVSAVAAGTVIALAFGLYSGSASAFGDLFPELLFCAALAGPLFHYRIVPAYSVSAGSVLSGEKAVLNEARLRRTKRRIAALADSFGAISSVMSGLSRVLGKPSIFELKQMCDEALDESCQNCGGRDRCWGTEYRSTAGAVTEMAAALRSGKKIGRDAFPEGLRNRCSHLDAILSRINLGCAMRKRTAADGNSSAVCAEDFSAMSKVLSAMSEEDDDDGAYDDGASLALAARLRSLGITADGVSVFGKTRRQVFVSGLESGCAAGGGEICAAAESVLGTRMTMPEYRIEGRHVLMSMYSAPAFKLKAGRCSIAKTGEKCGDSVTFFRGDGGYFYSLIADGMGSGKDAAFTSNLSALFLERLLGSGCSLALSLDMLNGFLIRRGMECFTTVDLMEADMVTGELRFVKSGAAPSFVLRGGRLFKLESSTVPVGILSPVDAEQIRFTARRGDFVIMLSDGVFGNEDECPWLYDMLCGSESLLSAGCDLNAAAESIALAASKATLGADDVSVCVAEVRGI